MEEWKTVPGHDGFYEASNLGRIRSACLSKKRGNDGIMKHALHEDGYVKISIIRNGRKVFTRSHVLVCLAFHGPKPTPEHVVNHKNGIKDDNRPENLEWVTRRENSIHSYKVLGNTRTRPRGHGKHWIAKYTDDEIRQIRGLRNDGLSYHQITRAMGHRTSWVSIQCILKGKTYSHVI